MAYMIQNKWQNPWQQLHVLTYNYVFAYSNELQQTQISKNDLLCRLIYMKSNLLPLKSKGVLTLSSAIGGLGTEVAYCTITGIPS